MDYKTRIEASIQEHLDAYMDIVKTLYDNPETGFEEYETQKVLVKYLEDAWIRCEIECCDRYRFCGRV